MVEAFYLCCCLWRGFIYLIHPGFAMVVWPDNHWFQWLLMVATSKLKCQCCCCREVFSSMRSTLEEPQRSRALSTMEISSQRCRHQRIVVLAMLTNDADAYYHTAGQRDRLQEHHPQGCLGRPQSLRQGENKGRTLQLRLSNLSQQPKTSQIYLTNLKHLRWWCTSPPRRRREGRARSASSSSRSPAVASDSAW